MNNQIKNFIEEGEKADLEYFAELEHIRWSKWQNYLHSFLVWNNDIKGWVLPHEKKEHWQSQINTPYQLLSEKEKDSDRDQVIPYLKRFSSRQISLIKMIVEMVESEKKEYTPTYPNPVYYQDALAKNCNDTLDTISSKLKSLTSEN
ncbi:MAG: hypothetical protein WC933_03770 [Candidatus Paceibacterota bacterium]|jgi:hypothetical protein